MTSSLLDMGDSTKLFSQSQLRQARPKTARVKPEVRRLAEEISGAKLESRFMKNIKQTFTLKKPVDKVGVKVSVGQFRL